ncbi:MAG TPA: hypothetical protein VF550_01920 [Polyangia bacterium]
MVPQLVVIQREVQPTYLVSMVALDGRIFAFGIFYEPLCRGWRVRRLGAKAGTSAPTLSLAFSTRYNRISVP